MKEIKDTFGSNSKWKWELFDLIPSQIWGYPRNIIFWETSEVIRINFSAVETQTKEEIIEDE